MVLGIDPGIERVGWGLVEMEGSGARFHKCGCITTSKDLPHASRIALVVAQLRALIEQESPDHVVIEKLFFAKNRKTAMAVAESRGAILAALTEANIRISEFTPLEVKAALVGNGRAEKKQVAWVVKNVLKIKENITSDDALDALALCLMVGPKSAV